MSGLASFQEALATLLYVEDELEAFRQDPAAWTRGRGLDAGQARLLVPLLPAHLRRFHDMQARDRAYFVQALFPLTLAFAREGTLDDYLRACPFGDDEYAREAASFAAWAATARADEPGVVDLARFEAERVSLWRHEPARVPPGHVMRAPHVRALRCRTDVPALVEALESGETASPLARDCHVALRREDGGEVVAAELDDAAGQLLVALATPLPRERIAHDPRTRDLLVALEAEGVVVSG